MAAGTIVRGRWVVTGGGPDDPIVTDGAVALDGDTILEVGPFEAIRAANPAATVIGSDKVAVLPGLINAHHHSAGATVLQQGVPDRLLESWLLARRRMRRSDIYLDTLISAARLLATGVTSVVDVHSGGGAAETYSDRVRQALKAYGESGIRVAFAAGVTTQNHIVSGSGEDRKFIDSLPDDMREAAQAQLPEPERLDQRDYLGVMESLCSEFADHPTIDVWFGPPGPQWVSDEFLQQIAAAAARHDVGVQTHVQESFYEKLHGRREYGKPTVLHLHDLGVLGPRFSIAHGVWLTEAEMAVMADTGACLSHNPGSNLRLRAGIAPLNALLDAGVSVALGMDGTTLNDDEDMFAEMRLALRLSRRPTFDDAALEPARILELATAGGARLLRKENRLGRLAPGFAADVVVVDLDRITWPWTAPEVDPRDLLIMRARAGDVTTVLVDGEVVYRDGRPTRIDLDAVGREVAARLDAEPFPADAARHAERLRPYLEGYYRDWEAPELEPYTVFNSRK